jgi:hypothetical protein
VREVVRRLLSFCLLFSISIMCLSWMLGDLGVPWAVGGRPGGGNGYLEKGIF